MTISREVL